jgi:hypothetical protein
MNRQTSFCAFCAFRLRQAYRATSFCGYSCFEGG